ncbi:MAG: DUF4266 domain-containing protein [Magnetococcales bacterium]|nr:DUF4266 domain-containing protein [Magnetococcales bacterium]
MSAQGHSQSQSLLRRFWILTLLAALAVMAGGCAVVEPWERDYLARPDMSFDPDPLEANARSQIYYSKETASGGYGVGGGGCGCN